MRAVILDTGCANLSSLAFALKRLGVGTARVAMEALANRGLVDLAREATQPLLGICLVEQLLGVRVKKPAACHFLVLLTLKYAT